MKIPAIPGRCEIAIREIVGEHKAALLLLVLISFLIGPGTAQGALIGGNYQLSYDIDSDTTETGETNVRKFKQSLDVKFRGMLSPLVQNEVTFRMEQEIISNAPDTTRFLPTLNLTFKGLSWDGKTGAKRTHENSDEPGKTPKINDNYFVELNYLPPKGVPDLKLKYTIDKELQEGITDTDKRALSLSSLYRPNDWLELKGSFSHDENKDRINPDADTVNDKVGGGIGLRHRLSSKIKFDTQYSVELEKGATLLSLGGRSGETDLQTHRWKNMASFRPFRFTTLDGSYDFDIKQNMIKGEHTLTTNARAALTQDIGQPIVLKGEVLRNIVESRHTTDDNRRTEDTLTGEANLKLSRQINLTFKYQKKITVEDYFIDQTKDTSAVQDITTVTWDGVLAPFWRASASYDRTNSFTKGSMTSIDSKYTLRSNFDFKAIDLLVEPTYDMTGKKDFTLAKETMIRDLKVHLAYRVFKTLYSEGRLDHTYGRKADSGLGNIQRTDSTTLNVTMTEVFPGWLLGFDATRTATDTSEDDLPPDITSSLSFRGDYVYRWFTMGGSYRMDFKNLGYDGVEYNAKFGWTTTNWETTLIYTFTKTNSPAINEGYTVSLVFKYNL